MEEVLVPFTRHGSEKEPIEVSADEILNAIAAGRDIHIEHATINEDLDIRDIVYQLDRGECGRPIISGNVNIQNCEIRGCLYFNNVLFKGDMKAYIRVDDYADFGYADFEKSAVFAGTRFGHFANFNFATFRNEAFFVDAVFSSSADFIYAKFSGTANFTSVRFDDGVHFFGATMKYPAFFGKVKFRENTVITGLWNLLVGRIERLSRKVTDFHDLNTITIMDASSNPYLKRYIEDEQWIASWRQQGRWRRVLFLFWELMSHCGKSIGLWAFWSLLIAAVFGFLHSGHITVESVSNWYTPFYFSVVTFTTLGFGDVTPLDWVGQMCITVEVVLGYVMLGGLISIFANKFARRS